MSKKPLVIVESPAKAKTISKFLGPGYLVEASFGHIRDLPSNADQVPEAVREKPWARLGVDVENGFEPVYVVPPQRQQQVTKLRGLIKEAKEVLLATDEDREGEAIAWHLLEVLRPKVPVKRMVFHEITREAVAHALASPRELNKPLVDAQESRRILDRLYGYEVSPVLWKKVLSGLSAGRVQSVAVRLVVVRERQRMKFVKASYWDVAGQLTARTTAKERVGTHLVELDGKRVATGKDFDPETGRLTGDAVLVAEAQARRIAEGLKARPFTVASVVSRDFTQKPSAPFITATLQQEAERKLRFTSDRTMKAAQSLFENGYITYHRTDSYNLSETAIKAARSLVADMYGASYLPPAPRSYGDKKVKGAQEAHEAIRPAGESFRTPEQLKAELDDDGLRLYELIWRRTVASQMKDAAGKRTTVHLEADAGPDGRARFVATGKVIEFAGFLRAYVEGSDDPDSELEDQERVLPPLRVGDQLDVHSLEAKGHATQPAARYTEASLIKEMVDRGIGRPSTYASILKTIRDRGYVFKKGSALVPTLTAFAVTNLMEKHFSTLVDYEFTRKMEEELDLIAEGGQDPKPWLGRFYFGGAGSRDAQEAGLKRLIAEGAGAIDARAISAVPLGLEWDGQPVVARVGRYGAYLQAGETGARANIPPELPLDELTPDHVQGLFARAEAGDRVVGNDPATGKAIFVKNGRFGPYVQVGGIEAEAPAEVGKTEEGKTEAGKKKAAKGKGKTAAVKPRMASLFEGMNPASVTLEEALEVLSFPKVLGTHPVSGEEIVARDGQYGPFVKCGTETRSIPDGHEGLRRIALEEALRLLAEPRRGRAQARQKALAEVGSHPKGGPMKVMAGRFGLYVTDGQVNASLPKGMEASQLTTERAIELIDAREAKLREDGKDPRGPGGGGAAAGRRNKPEAGASAAAVARPRRKAAGKR
jgi:DNA topoisomerase-1